MSILGLHIGVSFAEISLLGGSNLEPIAHQRIYLPRLPLRSALQKFLNKYAETGIEKIYCVSNHIDKLAPFRLGGSTAHLVTEGYENLAWLSQINPEPFKISRPPAVQSQELVFAVKERVSSQGEILEPLDLDLLNSIIAKLKLMDVKRVCIHFLHALKNTAHKKQTEELLKAAGFEVYSSNVDSNHDIEKSRRMAVNAGLSGTWDDFKEDVRAALEGENLDIPFYVLEKGRFLPLQETTEALEALSGLDSFWGLLPYKNIIYFGFENFYQVFPQNKNYLWQSPWGSIFREHPEKKNFSIQPTTSLQTNFWNELDYSAGYEGFEPGPMALGRGQKVTSFDLFFDELLDQPEVKDWLAPQAGNKILANLSALAKGSKNIDHSVVFELKTALLHQLHMEITPHEEKPEYFGFWTKFLNPLTAKQKSIRPLTEWIVQVGREQV